MDGTAMNVLMAYVGWRSPAVASIYVGVTASVPPSSGAKRSRDTAFIQADALPLSAGFGKAYTAFPRDKQR